MVKVLLVDDEEALRLMLARQLRRDGYDVTLAEDGLAAAQMLEEAEFDVVVSDMKMPRLDGMGLLRCAQETAPETEFIILTGHGSVENAVEAFKQGTLFDYMLKPLDDIKELGLTVGRAAERRRLRVENRRLVEEREDAELELAARALELARSNAELEQFAYVVSHDLQTPLRSISGYSQLLARRYQGKLDADADEFIGFVQDGTKRMHAMINDLLAYSRVNTQAQPAADADLNDVLAIVVRDLQAAITESGASVAVGAMPVVPVDRSLIARLFQNLIENAIKFRGEKPPHVTITVEEGLREWTFCIQDEGIGVEPAYYDRIFRVFQRLHAEGAYPGTGIGLAICKRIVDLHGGRIWVDSQPGLGTRFYFTLPRVARRLAAAA